MSWQEARCCRSMNSNQEGYVFDMLLTQITYWWYPEGSKSLNTLRPRQNGRHFADDTFKRIFMNENVRISINISLKLVPKDLINNIPALVQIMAWRRPGDKPLSETMVVSVLTHICVTRPQWVTARGYSMVDIRAEYIYIKYPWYY